MNLCRCGDDFDGCIIFDECHKAKNLCPSGAGKPTKTGQVTKLKNREEILGPVENPYPKKKPLNRPKITHKIIPRGFARLPEFAQKPSSNVFHPQTVLELQNKLPKARVVYASATGASEPKHMAYMVR